ncbi:MAG: hypothetical protein VKI81_05155 [Synechococcaceae cyanobacterium]|nr:hypothetical protein [Synechococcaceae cyanobacterium]
MILKLPLTAASALRKLPWLIAPEEAVISPSGAIILSEERTPQALLPSSASAVAPARTLVNPVMVFTVGWKGGGSAQERRSDSLLDLYR